MSNSNNEVAVLQSLLRSELSSVETYEQALKKVGNEHGSADIRLIEANHSKAVDHLRHLINQKGAEPETSSGAWGTFAKVIEGAATLISSTASLKVLKEGEENGVKNYEKALADSSLDEHSQALIRDTLLPAQRRHIPVLDRLIAEHTSSSTPNQ